MRATSFPWLRWAHVFQITIDEIDQEEAMSILLLIQLPVINLEISPVMGVSSVYWTCFSQNSFMDNCSSQADACFYHAILSVSEWPWNSCLTVPAKWINRKTQSAHSQITTGIILLKGERDHMLTYCFRIHPFIHQAPSFMLPSSRHYT